MCRRILPFLVMVLIPCTFAKPIFGFFDSADSRPKPEVGECTYWDKGSLYYSSNYDPDDLTGFHRTAPIGSYVTVVNEENGRNVSVRIVAHEPITEGRVMELSPAAFSQVSRLTEVIFDCQVFKNRNQGGFGQGGGYNNFPVRPNPPTTSSRPGTGMMKFPVFGSGSSFDVTLDHLLGNIQAPKPSSGIGHGISKYPTAIATGYEFEQSQEGPSQSEFDVSQFGPPPPLPGGVQRERSPSSNSNPCTF